MGITLSNKAVISIAKTYGAAKTMSAITNAVQAVATLAVGHSVAAGDLIELTSGWAGLNGRVVRALSVSTNDVTLESVDTSDVTKYPAGAGIGSVREILTWDNVTQIEDIQLSGGDQQFTDNTWVEDEEAREIPTIRSAMKLSMTVTDDLTLPYVATVQAADDAKTPVGLRIAFANGAKLFGNAYWSIQRTPTIAKNASLKSKIDLSFSSRTIRYAT